MEIFDLIIDEKVSVWRRSHISVKAESLEEAVRECLKNGSSAADPQEFFDSDYIYDTEEFMVSSLEDPCTIEVMGPDYNILGDNERGLSKQFC